MQRTLCLGPRCVYGPNSSSLFRCGKKALKPTVKGNKIVFWCTWLNDECIGAKCQYAYCEARAMDALQHLVDFIKRKKPDEDPVAYLYRLVEETLDPSERVDFYVESSEHFWREGLELVEKGELRQGSEKIWNSVVQLVKAAAEKKGLKHHTHRLVWATVRKIAMWRRGGKSFKSGT